MLKLIDTKFGGKKGATFKGVMAYLTMVSKSRGRDNVPALWKRTDGAYYTKAGEKILIPADETKRSTKKRGSSKGPKMDPIDLMIRGAFPGKSNAGLRRAIRSAATPNADNPNEPHTVVRGLSSRVTLSGSGKAKLDAIADALKDRAYLGSPRR